LYLSAIAPPNAATRKTGIWPEKLTAPSSTAEPVRRYTSHDWAIDCIHVPMSEISWPKKNKRKFRWRKARKAVGSRRRDGRVASMVLWT